jgi:hypothetical protein
MLPCDFSLTFDSPKLANNPVILAEHALFDTISGVKRAY